jgi:hypothetical protein
MGGIDVIMISGFYQTPLVSNSWTQYPWNTFLAQKHKTIMN